jgi:hypothetical protein
MLIDANKNESMFMRILYTISILLLVKLHDNTSSSRTNHPGGHRALHSEACFFLSSSGVGSRLLRDVST